MFFLHELDLDHKTLAPIAKKDVPEVEKSLGIDSNCRNRHRNQFRPNTTPDVSFPLGERPTWTEVRTCMKRNPRLFFKQWVWNEKWDADTDTSDLFIQFTCDIWLALDERVLQKPRPQITNLQEAMKFWTVTSVEEMLVSVSFTPNAFGLGHTVSQTWSFRELLAVFFPDPDTAVPNRSAWRSFRDHGYLKRFGELKDTLTEARFQKLKRNLAYLMTKVQSLPHTRPLSSRNRNTTLWSASAGTIKMVTNPKYYKLKGIGKGAKAAVRKNATRINNHPAQIAIQLNKIHLGTSARTTRRAQRLVVSANKGARSSGNQK